MHRTKEKTCRADAGGREHLALAQAAKLEACETRVLANLDPPLNLQALEPRGQHRSASSLRHCCAARRQYDTRDSEVPGCPALAVSPTRTSLLYESAFIVSRSFSHSVLPDLCLRDAGWIRAGESHPKQTSSSSPEAVKERSIEPADTLVDFIRARQESRASHPRGQSRPRERRRLRAARAPPGCPPAAMISVGR